jgi:hypothetical protein
MFSIETADLRIGSNRRNPGAAAISKVSPFWQHLALDAETREVE